MKREDNMTHPGASNTECPQATPVDLRPPTAARPPAAPRTNAFGQPLEPAPGALKARVIVVTSARPNVGKTTLVAALASSLQLPRGQTFALDLDPKNALAARLGATATATGLIHAQQHGKNWRDASLGGFADSRVLAFGNATCEQQRDLEKHLRQDPLWLARQLAAMNLEERDLVIIDTPAGESPYLSQALGLADKALVVTLADTSSYRYANYMERLLLPYLEQDNPPQSYFVINRVDITSSFNLDMCQVLKKRLGRQLLGVVHCDPVIRLAGSEGRDPLEQVPHSRGCSDLLNITGALYEQLLVPTL
ncbi:cellulose biosynthesis protein BcsQ [Pseudomonas sp. Irchel 3E20]|uniref:cellulose biosynthesis protein BcsQ n=1 Tax=Pseudomonas sp. Irchel 3E20 TaxID=2008983 RepID=UPI000BA4C2EE|nr:cellulose biosynthesis protein BcsQ [Pseudomonas sp. Irchel 3E20]